MPSRTLAGIGLKGFWNLGENGWNTEMDENLRLLSAVSQMSVLSIVSSLPTSDLTDGMIYIVSTGANANSIAVRDNGAWVYLVPKAGWKCWNVAAQSELLFNGTAWAPVAAGASSQLEIVNITGDYTLSLGDAGKYVRCNSGSARTVFVPRITSVPWAVGTQIHVRRAGTGALSIRAGVGVTIRSAGTLNLRAQHSTATLIKINALDEWDLTGDIEVSA